MSFSARKVLGLGNDFDFLFNFKTWLAKEERVVRLLWISVSLVQIIIGLSSGDM